MTKKEKIAFISSLIYIGIMAVGMYVLKNVAKSSYVRTDMVNTLIYFEIIMTLFSAFIYIKYFRGMSFNKLEKFPFGSVTSSLFSIMFILLIFIGIVQLVTSKYVGKDMFLVFMVFLTTLFVGISEELMFRGILLPVFMQKRGSVRAVMVSSSMFSALHSVNVLGGLPINSVFIQLVITFILGTLFACVLIEIKNIIPIMIYHALLDAFIISAKYLDNLSGGLLVILTLVEIIFAIVMIIILMKKRKMRV